MNKNKHLELAHKHMTLMLKEINDFCKLNDIPYFIIGGTLLGAVRHKGFIPWDADIDIALYRKDYEKLISLLKEKETSFNISVPGDKGHYSPHAILYSKTVEITMAYKKNGINKKEFLYLDVFPIDYTTSNIKEQKKQARTQARLKRVLYLKRGLTTRKNYFSQLYVSLRTLLLKLIPLKAISKLLQKNMKKYSSETDSHLVVSMASKYDFFKVMFKDDLFGMPTQIDFNGIKVMGPTKIDEVLKHYYNDDYMTLPSEVIQDEGYNYIIDCVVKN